jgi:hypothetical protein
LSRSGNAWWAWLCLTAAAAAQTAPAPATPVIGAPDVPVAPVIGPKTPDLPPDALFAGFVPRLTLIIPPESMAALAKDPRALVKFTLKETNGQTLENCSLKLKGSAGSFRQINEDRPGFSIRTDKVKKSQEFRGSSKFQLNNCAQDGTMLHEQIAGEMSRKAGIVASRCTHAYVTLNNKVLGTYVLKEGFNGELLSYFFKNTSGHLYDGGFLNEINPNLEVDKGDPAEKSRLLELCGALGEPDPAKRLQRMDKILDIDAYFRYLALEQVLCHWDGYSFNQNNYRIYEDPGAGKFYFLLHGMDQVFANDNRWYIFKPPAKAIPNALLFDKTMRERARTQFFGVYEKVLRPIDWPRRANEIAADLKLKLKPIDPEESKRFEQRGKDAAGHIKARLDVVKAQVEDAYRLRGAGGKAVLGAANYAWTWSTDKGEAKEVNLGGKDCLYVKVGAEKGADWRLPLSLSPGRYRLEGKLQWKGVKAGAGDNAKGGRLRVSGVGAGDNAKNPPLIGDSPWKSVSVDFTVTDADPTLVIELRGEAGELWADRGSLTVTRLP